MLNKLAALNNLLSSCLYDIICVTETWLSKKVTDSLLIQNLPYAVIRSDRNSSKGGGACLFVANHIPFKTISTSNIYHTDIVCIEIFDTFSSDSFILINVYSPPNFKNFDDYVSFLDCLSEFVTAFPTFVIVGDFNVPKVNWSVPIDNHFSTCTIEKAIIDFAHNHHARQHIDFPTRKDNILDLLFTSTSTVVHDLTSLPPFGLDKQSDHHSFSFCLQHATKNKPNTASRNFHSANYIPINNYFMSINWQAIFTSCPTTNEHGLYDPLVYLNAMYLLFINVVHGAIDFYIPTSKQRPIHASYPKHIKSLFEYRIKLWHEKQIDKFVKCSEKLNKEVSKFTRYKQRRNLHNIKTKYKYAGSFLKTKKRKIPTLIHKGKTLFTETDKSEALSETFNSFFKKD